MRYIYMLYVDSVGAGFQYKSRRPFSVHRELVPQLVPPSFQWTDGFEWAVSRLFRFPNLSLPHHPWWKCHLFLVGSRTAMEIACLLCGLTNCYMSRPLHYTVLRELLNWPRSLSKRSQRRVTRSRDLSTFEFLSYAWRGWRYQLCFLSLVTIYVELRSCDRSDGFLMIYDNDNVYTHIHRFYSYLKEV